MRSDFCLGKFSANGDSAPYILAEIGINHNGDIELAKRTIAAAAKAGVHGVKFQSFFTEEFIQRGGPGFDIFKQCELSVKDHQEISKTCKDLGVHFVSTPLSLSWVDLLADCGADALKVASGDVTFYDLIEKITRTELPLILSTGMATFGEIEQVARLPYLKDYPVILLHCISNYPPRLEDNHLRFIRTLDTLLDCPVGFSDHSLGVTMAVGAVALGARLIEKHFTLDKNLPGPDHRMSLNPEELQELVRATADIHKALGKALKPEIEGERPVKAIARRGLYRRRSISETTLATQENCIWMRPPNGIDPTRVSLLHSSHLITPHEQNVVEPDQIEPVKR